MKLLASPLLLSAAFAQSPDGQRIVTFNRADAEHCKVITVSDQPMLATTYEGTTVAITMPQNWNNGEFSVFITVAQVGPGEETLIRKRSLPFTPTLITPAFIGSIRLMIWIPSPACRPRAMVNPAVLLPRARRAGRPRGVRFHDRKQ